MKNISKLLISGLFPLVFLLLGYQACLHMDNFTEFQLTLIHYTPYLLLVISAAIAWKFNRSRSFFMSFLFLLSLMIVDYSENKVALLHPSYLLLCCLLPINLLLFTIWKERGFLSLWGILRFSFLLTQAGLFYWVIAYQKEDLLHQYLEDLLPFSLKPVISISQVAFLLFLLAFLVLCVRIVLYRASQDLFYLYILTALFLMLNANTLLAYDVYFNVCGVLLILSILQDSYVMAFYDDLTGIPSRRALNQDLLKLGMRYSIAMLDIDYFKKFNDTYGHETGDEVLKFIASIIKEVKGHGRAYRYGGEEFTILFPGKSLDSVMPVLEDLRETIAKRGFVVRKKRRTRYSSKKTKGRNKSRQGSKRENNKKIYIHVSIGVAQKDETKKTALMVIKAADSALYRAKKKGRNCVCK